MLFVDASQQNLSVEQQLYLAYQLAMVTQQEMDRLSADNTTLKTENGALKTEVDILQDEITRLKEQLKLAQQRHFGKKSEVGEPIIDTNEVPLVHVGAHTRKKKSKGRLIDLSSLPRRTVFHDLPAACRLFLRNLPGHPSPRQGQKQATSMPPAALAVLVPLDFDPPSGLKIYAPQ